MTHATRHALPDGRWHFQHGPIDVVIGADGEPAAVAASHEAAWARFGGLLDELVSELALLRRPIDVHGGGRGPLAGPVASQMWRACHPYRARYITPMAAVAGAVADELIACYRRPGIARAWANNGGDIALHLDPQQSVRIGLYADLARFDAAQAGRPLLVDGRFTVAASLPVRGVATSGWRGRSFSLGIADSVTVLAETAAAADAAATVIANAVDVDDPAIARRPACELKDDSDLGAIAVTVDVPRLADAQVQRALRAGARRARELRGAGLIWSAALVCQDQVMTTDSQAIGRLLSPGSSAPPPGRLPLAAPHARGGAVGSVFA